MLLLQHGALGPALQVALLLLKLLTAVNCFPLVQIAQLNLKFMEQVRDTVNHLSLDCDHISVEPLCNDAEAPQQPECVGNWVLNCP